MLSKKSIRRNNSGQMLIITSLVVVLLIISTVVYVTDIEKTAPVFVSNGDSGLTATRQAAAHTLVSALANITNGGNEGTLVDDLNRLKLAVESVSYNAISELSFVVSNSTPYSNGVWIFRGNDGEGISSLLVDIALNSTGNSVRCHSEFAINIASSIKISGNYTILDENQSLVVLTCKVFNEGAPSLASNFTFGYLNNETIILVPSFSTSTVDYGNGTFVSMFHVQYVPQNGRLQISANCVDARGISIWTNVTCPQT